MRASVLTVFLVAVTVTAAHAQQKTAAEKEAEQHFKEAKAAYDAGDYKKAVQGFLTAYQLVPSANQLLYNIGQAYRMSDDPEKALSYYEKFVAFSPNSAEVPLAKQYIADLKVKAETERRERELKGEEERRKQEQQAEAQRKAEEEKQRNAQLLIAQRRDAEQAGSGLRVGGLVVGGLGVVGVGVGIGLAASDKFDAKSGVAIGVGGAALVAGGVMYYLGVKKRSDARAALPKTGLLVPLIHGDAVGVAWMTQF
jgi:tetratricopeptide (TPR) repeat protein